MGRGAGAVTAGSSVAFSWEHEPGVSKQSTVEAKKAAAGTQQPRRMRVPPPPGGPGAPALSPPARSGSRSRGGLRPEEDPFLAAYLACTASGGRKEAAGRKGGQKLLGWTGLGLSCKTSCGVVEARVVRLA